MERGSRERCEELSSAVINNSILDSVFWPLLSNRGIIELLITALIRTGVDENLYHISMKN